MNALESQMFHPLANIFPMMNEEEFRELVKDIDANGLTDPIVKYEGKILDGRNRWRACQHLGIPHREVQFDQLKLGSDDPAAFVWSRNTVRRHLSHGQISMAAQALEELGWGGNRSKKPIGSLGTDETEDGAKPERAPKTRAQIAEETGASVKGMAKAAKVRKRATPKVVKAVESGDLALDTAARIAEFPEDQQEEIMNAPQPSAAVARAETVGTQKPTARKAPSATVTMRGHMTGHQSGIRDVQLINKYWAEHSEEIDKLDPADLRSFVKDLEESRRASSQLLSLLTEKLIPEWTLPGRQPALLSTALNKIDAAADTEATAKDTEGK